MNLEEGTRVRATKRIVESDVEPDPEAEPCYPGWVHAEEGDEGEVAFVDPVTFVRDGETGEVDRLDKPSITVRFDQSGTATLVLDGEVEAIDHRE